MTLLRRARGLLAPALLALAFGLLTVPGVAGAESLVVGDVTIALRQAGPSADLGEAGLRTWVQRSATIVRGYFLAFPVRQVDVLVQLIDGDRVGGGQTFGYPQPHIKVAVGRHVSEAALEQDWVLVHEMIHLALPEVDDEQNWFAEGVATYVEGVARVQAGNLSNAELWAEYLQAMPKGLPQDGDQGLDRTHTWGRTYWGGALFCLIADVGIREHTHNRRGLQDALRAIARAGGGMAARWPIERILTAGDAATATNEMTSLYRAMRDQPTAPDLEALWIRLGIKRSDGSVLFDDSAPLAAVRLAITQPNVASK